MTNPQPPFDMTMDFGPDGTYPFIEDEDANITGFGHQDKAEFAAAINRYDEVMNGGPYDPDEQWTAEDIAHKWAITGHTEDGEPYVTTKGATVDTPGALPITTLWGQR